VWRFDPDPTSPKENVHSYYRNRTESPSTIMGMPVFYNNRIYVCGGGDIWWGKREAWVQCIDATATGDSTDKGPLWKYPVADHCCATPAIYNGLVFVSDYGRHIHCVDADTGKPYWIQRTRGAMFSSCFVADGKVYVGNKDRNLWVFAAEKEKHVLATIDLGSPIIATPIAANGTLYVATMKTLYAVSK
jgi:outer membrane protein assembly factor BamB